MIGTFFGLGIAWAYVAAAWNREFAEDGLLVMYLAAPVLLIGGLLVGLVFTRTIGIAAMFAMAGAAIAGIITMFNGQLAYTPAMILHVVVRWLLGLILAQVNPVAALRARTRWP